MNFIPRNKVGVVGLPASESKEKVLKVPLRAYAFYRGCHTSIILYVR